MTQKFSQEIIEKAASEIAVGLANGFAVLFSGEEKEQEPGKEPGKEPPRRIRRARGHATATAPPKERAPSEDDVKKVIANVIQEFDNEGAFDVLEPFGVRKVKQLKPDQFADVIAAAKKYLEEDDPNG